MQLPAAGRNRQFAVKTRTWNALVTTDSPAANRCGAVFVCVQVEMSAGPKSGRILLDFPPIATAFPFPEFLSPVLKKSDPVFGGRHGPQACSTVKSLFLVPFRRLVMFGSNRKSRRFANSPSGQKHGQKSPSKIARSAPLAFEKLDARINFSGLSGGPPSGVFDLDLFEQNIQRTFYDSSAGFAYSINQDGQIAVRSGADGNARMEEGERIKLFTPDTVTTIASVAKTITGTAIMQLFQNQGQSVDSTIYPFLPAEWRNALDAPQRAAAKASVQTITFRELLTHTSGIRVQDQDGDGSISLTEQTSFAGLRVTILGGVNMANKAIVDYQNANFALMRVMLPYIWNEVDNAELDNAADPATLTAAYYVSYVRDNVLGPMGIADADTKPVAGDDVLHYAWPDDGSDSIAYGDRTTLAGGEGWFLSVNELAAFLAHVRYDDTILSESTRGQMRSGLLGWRNPDDAVYGRGMFGDYYSHGGGLDRLLTGIMDFPNGVQIAIAANSDIDPQNMPHYTAYANASPHQLLMVQRAYENAWPEITIGGSADPDTFEIRANNSNTGAVDILLNNVLVVTRWDETLDKITFNGAGGNDTFIIGALPGTFELVVNGGAGADVFRIADRPGVGWGQGNVTINGGSGADELYFDESSSLGAQTYVVSSTAITKSSRPAPVNYSSISSLHVYAGGSNDTIRVNSTASGTEVFVYGEAGTDTIRVGNQDLSVNLRNSVRVFGGTGTDTVILDDRNGGNALTNYVLQPTWFTQDGYSGLVHQTDIETVSLQTTNQASNVHVRGTLPGQSVQINGRDGNDALYVHSTAAGSSVSFLGGAHDDTVVLTPETADLDMLQGGIGFDGGTDEDRLRLHDDNDLGLDFPGPGNPYHDTYTVLSAAVLRGSDFADVTYLATETVDLRANQYRNLIRVNGLSSTTDLLVYAGGGDDDIVVANTSRDLDTSIAGDIALYGGAGSDLVHFRDSSDESGNDSYQIQNTTFTKTGIDSWFYSQMESMVLDANPFSNNIEVSGVGPIDLTINAGGGDDTIDIGVSRADLVRANIHVRGDAGSDRVNINAMETPGNVAWTFDGGTVDMSVATFGSLDHTAIERVVLNAPAGIDNVTVISSPADTDLDFQLNAGNDRVRIGTGLVNSIGGNVIVNGGAGTDYLTVDDHDHGESATWGVNVSSVFRNDFSASHSEIDRVLLRSGNSNDQINVYSTAAGVETIIRAGQGDDRVSLSPLANNLGTIAGPLEVRGEQGLDMVVARDDLFAGGPATPYSVQTSSLSRNGFGGVSHSTIEEMRVVSGAGDNVFNVLGYNPDVLFALYGQNGNDTFNVWTGPEGSGTGGLVQIYGGPENLVGQGDRLNVFHQNPLSVTHDKDPVDPEKGSIVAQYLDVKFDLDYQDIEIVV
jgi:CubicO group peptidase (beta-lactamase class C family)